MPIRNYNDLIIQNYISSDLAIMFVKVKREKMWFLYYEK